MIQPREGRSYRTRDGRKADIQRPSGMTPYIHMGRINSKDPEGIDSEEITWNAQGYFLGKHTQAEEDLVAPWTEPEPRNY